MEGQKISDLENHSDSTSSLHPPVIGRWAIINVSDLCREFWYLFTLRSCCSTHHRGLIRFRISDGKFVNHTTEMILWSMILIMHSRFCLYNKTKIKLQIGEQNFEPSNKMMHLGWYATRKFELLLIFLSHHHCPRWTMSKTPRHLSEEGWAFQPKCALPGPVDHVLFVFLRIL